MGLKAKRHTPKQPRRRIRARRVGILASYKHYGLQGKGLLRASIRALRALPPPIRAIIIPTLLFLVWFGVNWAYHTFNKPSEIFFPLDHSLKKHPEETWNQYESLFREHGTAIITPEFLAALAQVEGAGNPVARTYWRWQLSWNPLEWYQPASSAVGMFQITDGTFAEAKRYCIHDHLVVEDGPWHDWHSCWFNSLYTRVLPSHAIELTAALLDQQVAQTIGAQQLNKVPIQQKQDLAAVIHLCGAGVGRTYAAHRFRLSTRYRCGDHDVKNYLTRIHSLQHRFATQAERNETTRQAR